jgi:hypothetical protein
MAVGVSKFKFLVPCYRNYLTCNVTARRSAFAASSLLVSRDYHKSTAVSVLQPSLLYRCSSQIVRNCSYARHRHSGIDMSSTAVSNDRQVLPKNVKPIHYDVTLEPDLEKFTYEGTVAIE